MEEDEVMNYFFTSERGAKPTVKRGGSQVQGPGAGGDKADGEQPQANRTTNVKGDEYPLYLYINLSRLLSLITVKFPQSQALSELRLLSRCLCVCS